MMDEAQWTERNAAFWNQAAARWRGQRQPGSELIQGLTTDLACAPGSLLLDAGCGPGLWSVALARAGYRVRGIDVSPQMIAEGQQLAGEYGIGSDTIGFEVGTVDRIDAADVSYDGILCRCVLDFVPAPGVALTELWRVLKPGRRLAISVLGARSPVKRAFWRRFLPGSDAPVPMNHILPWEAEALLAELGWEIVRQRPLFGPAVSGADNEYTAEMAEQLGDRVLQQAIATAWAFLAVKPGPLR